MRTAAAALAFALLGLWFAGAAQASGGSLVAWGNNYSGQLGNGTTNTGSCECFPSPVPVPGLTGVVEIAGNSSGAIALLADGTVMAWGDNFYGQLGNGGTADSLVPVPVPGLSGVIAVAAGWEYNFALLANGTVMAWGQNGSGQLGTGSIVGPETCGAYGCRKVPAPVPGLANVVALSAARRSSLALLADGTVMAWGENPTGQNGDGVGIRTGCECIATPQRVPGVSGAVAISNGSDDGMALLVDGTVMAWGGNYGGQLGIGNTTGGPGCSCLGPVAVPGLSGVKAISAGAFHNFALAASGAVSGWGMNGAGEVGNGSSNESGCGCVSAVTPVINLPAARAVQASEYNSLALLPNGTAVGWGLGKTGDVGDGGVSDRHSPVPVAVAGASGIGGKGLTSYVLVGPSQTLTVTTAGAGSGAVGTRELVCPPACSTPYPQGQTEILRAEPAAGSGFAGFSGPCAGTAPCQVRLDTDQTVTATFGPPKGTAIAKAVIKPKQKKATFSFTAPGAITGFECNLIKPKAPKKHAKAGASQSKGGKKKARPKFTACTSAKTYKHLKPGGYKFEVRALDILGADAVPAVKKFKLKSPKKHRHKS